MNMQLLLLEDVMGLGRKGEIVSVKPGYARNFLLPKRKAVVAGPHTREMQAKLQAERQKIAEQERQEAEALSKKLTGSVLSTEVKVDAAGNMYGSVSSSDIVKLFETESGIALDKHVVELKHPIKKTGVYHLKLHLGEGVEVEFELKVMAEGAKEEVKAT